MSQCPSQTFNITPEKFQALKNELAASGYQVQANVGQQTVEGVTLSWSYDPDAGILIIGVPSKPFLIPCGTIESKILHAITG